MTTAATEHATMTSIATLLAARWFLTLVGTLVLSLLLWFAGPLIVIGEIRPLDGELPRLAVVLALLAIWAAANALAWRRARRTDQALLDGATAGGGLEDGVAAEMKALRDRLEDSIALLRKADPAGGKGRRFLYQLPWYIMIGPPGSGKSTALENSGLIRQTADRPGRGGIRGVGGTRNCRWLFTEQAVLIDTAGRYTTQDSHETVDAAGWNGFLDLLKRTRPRQPISGAIVAISVATLATGSEAERSAHADAIRQRLNELYGRFGVRFPTYLLLTKADLIVGFTEFFDDLGKAEREQVWGVTFPYSQDEGGDDSLDRFGAEFDALVERLHQRLLDRLQQETDVERRGLIYGFPAQVASLKEPLLQFLADVFEPSRFESRPLLRGAYLTSGTQEGTPIDRLTAGFARMIGLDRRVASASPGAGRSYFLTALLRDVVFPEASLVGADPTVERRLRRIQWAGLAASAVLVTAALTAWTVSLLENRALVAEANATTDRFVQQMEALAPEAGRLPGPGAVLPPLDTLRALAAKEKEPPALTATFGLHQGGKIYPEAAETYQRALKTLLLPPLVYRLESQIRQHQQDTDFLYEALKVYLMLTARGPLDHSLVRRWLELDLATLHPDPSAAPVRDSLNAHIASLLSAPLTVPAPDGQPPQPAVTADLPLIEQSQRQLARYPLAERAYAHLKQLPAARRLPEWRIVDVGGPSSARVFARRSPDKRLSDGIPGLYTRDGFYSVLLPALSGIAGETARESWVLAEAGGTNKEGRESGADRLERDVLQLYLADYIARWDALLADVTLVPTPNIATAAQVAAELSGPASPLRNLLAGAAAQTRLAVGKSGAAADAATAAGVANALRLPGADRLASVMAASSAAVAALPEPGRPVDDHFAPLHGFVEGRGGVPGSSLDDLMRLLNDLYGQLSRMQQAGPGTTSAAPGAPLGPSPAQQLATAAARMPGPVAALAQQMSKAGSSAAVGNTRSELNAAWTAQVLPFCRQATENRYPVNRSGAADVMLADFAKLFGPGALIDSFFKQNLQPYVDMSRQPWQWQRVDGVELGIPAGVLGQFQRAAAIRDAFFTGGAGPLVRFDLAQTALDAEVKQAVVEIDGQAVTFVPGAARPMPVQWPGAVGQTRVTLNGAATPDIVVDGPWSWFRLLDRARLSAGGSRDRIAVTLPAAGRSIGFELRAGSVLNPFTLKELGEFRCPAAL